MIARVNISEGETAKRGENLNLQPAGRLEALPCSLAWAPVELQVSRMSWERWAWPSYAGGVTFLLFYWPAGSDLGTLSSGIEVTVNDSTPRHLWPAATFTAHIRSREAFIRREDGCSGGIACSILPQV